MPDSSSTLKVAAVTCGMGGISQDIVIALTQRDFDVVACDRTIDPAIAERITTNAAPPGARLFFIRNDLADPGDLPASSIQYSLPSFTAFGHIERLVNNAGLSAKSRGDRSTSPPRAMTFAVNARGAFFLPRPCSLPRPTFPKARGGVCDVQSDGRQTAKLFGIRLAPNGIAVYEVPTLSDSHADDRCGSIAF